MAYTYEGLHPCVDPKPRGLATMLWALNPKPRGLATMLWALNPKPRSLATMLWALNPKPRSLTPKPCFPDAGAVPGSPYTPYTPFTLPLGLPLCLTASMLSGINTTADACNGTDVGNMTGCIALIQRGTCYFMDKVANAQAAGAAAAVIWNNVPGILSGLAGKLAVQGLGCGVWGAGCAGCKVRGAGCGV